MDGSGDTRGGLPTGIRILCGLLAFAIGCAPIGGESGVQDGGTTVPEVAVDTGPVDTGLPAEDLIAPPAGACAKPEDWQVATYVIDGDTFILADIAETRVRMLGIDAPEMNKSKPPPECGAVRATNSLRSVLPDGALVCLVGDASAGDKDKYDRLLRYAYVKNAHGVWQVNAWLVRQGLVRVFQEFVDGLQYEADLRAMEKTAKKAHLGGWDDCGW